MKKIAILLAGIGIGGLEKVTVELANKLSNKGYDVDLIVHADKQENYQIMANSYFLNIQYNFIEKVFRKINRQYLNSFEGSIWKEKKQLARLFMDNQYDVIIASDGLQTMILNTIMQANPELFTKIKCIGWMHNNYQTYMFNYFVNQQEELKKALQNMDNVVVLTQKDKNDYSIHNQNTECIYNFITINSIEKMSEKKKNQLLFVARLSKEHKGLDYLVSIAIKIKESNLDIQINILGDGPDKEWLNLEIQKYNLENILILHGNVTENIEKYYQEATILISTSKWEGLPLVMIEAISAGLPVVSFNHTGAQEILINETGILIEMGDTDTFVDEIQKITSSEELQQKYSLRSQQRALDFKTEKLITEWEALINEK